MNDGKIRVLLVDDHTLFRSGIQSLLERHPEFAVVGEAGDGLEGAKRAKSLEPDAVLLDLHMPGVSGLETLRMIIEENRSARVLMLTVSENGEDLSDALRAGATGYLLKNVGSEILIDAIRRAAQGESVVSAHMVSKLVEQMRRGSPTAMPPQGDKLSPREREILSLVARGDSNKEIARQLELAESTIKIHVQSILKKLNLTSRVQAAVYAVEHPFEIDSHRHR